MNEIAMWFRSDAGGTAILIVELLFLVGVLGALIIEVVNHDGLNWTPEDEARAELDRDAQDLEQEMKLEPKEY